MAQGGVVRVSVSRDCLETWDAIGGAPIEPVISEGGIKRAIMSDSVHAFQIESIVRRSRVLVMSKASTLASWTHIVRCDAFAYRCVEQQQVPTPSASSKVAFITVQRRYEKRQRVSEAGKNKETRLVYGTRLRRIRGLGERRVGWQKYD